MSIATIAVDLAKSVFELAAADETGKIVERRRLTHNNLNVTLRTAKPLTW